MNSDCLVLNCKTTYAPNIMFELCTWTEDTASAKDGEFEIDTSTKRTNYDSHQHVAYVLEESADKKQLTQDWDPTALQDNFFFIKKGNMGQYFPFNVLPLPALA